MCSMNPANYFLKTYVVIGFEGLVPRTVEKFTQTPVSVRAYNGLGVMQLYTNYMRLNPHCGLEFNTFIKQFIVLKGLIIENNFFERDMLRILIKQGYLEDVSNPLDRYKTLLGTNKLYRSKQMKYAREFPYSRFMSPCQIRNKV